MRCQQLQFNKECKPLTAKDITCFRKVTVQHYGNVPVRKFKANLFCEKLLWESKPHADKIYEVGRKIEMQAVDLTQRETFYLNCMTFTAQRNEFIANADNKENKMKPREMSVLYEKKEL